MAHPTQILRIEQRPSPNFNERRAEVDILLLHYTGMASCDAALSRLCDPASEVSCHYVITQSGQLIQLVEERQRAWHAGQGTWQGRGDINSRSIGVEICNGGHEFGSPPFPARQIAAVIALCHDILRRWPIAKTHILAHSDIAPTRKRDPGERFPWGRLAQAGLGHWVAPSRVHGTTKLGPGASGAKIAELQSKLADYGYELAVTGDYDAATLAVVQAFQRHFYPIRCDGIADAPTFATLNRLMKNPPLSN